MDLRFGGFIKTSARTHGIVPQGGDLTEHQAHHAYTPHTVLHTCPTCMRVTRKTASKDL